LPRKSENDAGREGNSVILFAAEDMGNCPEPVINGISWGNGKLEVKTELTKQSTFTAMLPVERDEA
jgi:hypothetical protein